MSLDDDAVRERLERRLMGEGIYVERFATDDEGVHVGYETAAPGESVPHREVGQVLNVFIDAHEEGWDPRDVHGYVYELNDGPRRGHWQADAGWFRALANGNLSETDFSTLVLSTLG